MKTPKYYPLIRPIMTAPDMFNPDSNQVFDKVTGERLSYGSQPVCTTEPEPIVNLNDVFTSQLALF